MNSNTVCLLCRIPLTVNVSRCFPMCARSFSRQPAFTTRYTSVGDTCAAHVKISLSTKLRSHLVNNNHRPKADSILMLTLQ